MGGSRRADSVSVLFARSVRVDGRALMGGDVDVVGREGGHGIEEYMNVKLIAFGGL